MLLTVALASSRLKMHKGGTKAQKAAMARAAKDQLNSVRTDLDALLATIGNGGIYYPARLKDDNKTTEVENFEESNLVVLDIDNTNPDAPTLSWSEAVQHPYVQAHAAFLHESPNYSAEQNRYRIGFILPEALTDYYVWKEVAARIAAHFPAQYDLILRPTWGYHGCRRTSMGGKSTQVVSRAEFDRLTDGLMEEQQRRRQRTQRADEQVDTISFEQAETILSFIPTHLHYEEWQSIVFGLANTFENHEAAQLIEAWSPGRDKLYLKLIRQNNRRKHSGANRVTMATVVAFAKQYGYIPPHHTQSKQETLRYDRTLTVGRWVSEAAPELFSIIQQNPKTLIVSRTGNGKSKFIELLARRGSVLVVSPLAKLAEQQGAEFEAVGAVAVTGGEAPEVADAYFAYRDVVCTTPEMLAQYMHCIDRFEYVVIDEIHELRRMNYRPVALAAINNALQRARRIIGLTATLTDNMFREDGFFVLRIDDCRTDHLKVQLREFSGGATTGNNTTALVCRLVHDHIGTTNLCSNESDHLTVTASGTPAHRSNHEILVIRLQSKKQLRVVHDYCRSTLLLPDAAVAVLTSENKNTSEIFSSIVEHRLIPDPVRVVLTTSVFDLGMNILNTNICRLALIEPKDEVEVIQFSARFRNVNLPVECWYPERTNDHKRKQWTHDLLRKYRYNYDRATDICTVLNIAALPGNRALYNRVSAISKYQFIQRIDEAYRVNTLFMAAMLYREYAGALLSGPGRFFSVMAERYPYCDIERLPVLNLDADAAIEQVQDAFQQREKSIEEALYSCLKEQRTPFLTNVFHAHTADRNLRKRLLSDEFEGLRPVEDEVSITLKRHYMELFGENIFLRPMARTLAKRYLDLRNLLLSQTESVRIVDSYRTPEQWHNTTVEFETMRRQYLLQHRPEALSPKWKKEAEAVRAVADVLHHKEDILTGDVLQTVNEVMKKHLFAMKKRESAKLVRILFGTFKRRGREKITYYDCRRKRTFEDTLHRFQIDPDAYLNAVAMTVAVDRNSNQPVVETRVAELIRMDSE